ncbi:MAG TPA: TetR/AcrR family transcriptional regulator [Candidatus Xenobia bacterium]|jgi:TetR/AcrR family transcriptional repressor of bet genes
MGRSSNTEKRRTQIVRAMEKLMATHGYEKTTITALGEAAGLSPGLVHYHFSNKQEVLIELVRDLGRRLSERHQAACREAGDDARARLEAWLDAHVALGPGADAAAVACWTAIAAEAIRQSEVHAVYVEALQQELQELTGLLQAVRPSGDHAAMAVALLSAIQGAYLLGTAAPEVALRGFAKEAVHALVDGLLLRA